jgi:hypothetical protein
MTRTILTGLVIVLSLAAAASAEACIVATTKPVNCLAFDHVFPHAAGAALRKEGELRGIQFLVSAEPTQRVRNGGDSLLRLLKLDRAAQQAEQMQRDRTMNLVRLTAPDWLIDAGIAQIAENLC